MTHHAAQELGLVEKWIAPRRKAIAAFLIPLLGGAATLAATGTLDLPHLLGLLGTALGSGGVVHQVTNDDPPTPTAGAGE